MCFSYVNFDQVMVWYILMDPCSYITTSNSWQKCGCFETKMMEPAMVIFKGLWEATLLQDLKLLKDLKFLHTMYLYIPCVCVRTRACVHVSTYQRVDKISEAWFMITVRILCLLGNITRWAETSWKPYNSKPWIEAHTPIHTQQIQYNLLSSPTVIKGRLHVSEWIALIWSNGKG